MPEPTAAAPAPAVTAATLSRAFADTRPTPVGRTRGTAAARATPYALDRTRTARARGYSPREAVAPAITQVSSPRPPVVSARTVRRPCGKRSSSGPATGTSSENGSIVSTR